jgi:hypothetical protein
MNRAFDYNGVSVAPSKPVQKLRTVKKVLHVDSGDRDFVQYPPNGDMVLYLPRVYERVVSLNVISAEIPGIGNSFVHSYATGSTFGSDVATGTTGLYYMLLDAEGLNKCDETTPRADRSSRVDSSLAKFQITSNTYTDPLIYNSSSGARNEAYFQPPISKLDRLHLRTRLHSQVGASGIGQDSAGFIYTSGGNCATNLEYSLTLEIETVENSFDDMSSFETRIGERVGGFHGC